MQVGAATIEPDVCGGDCGGQPLGPRALGGASSSKLETLAVGDCGQRRSANVWGDADTASDRRRRGIERRLAWCRSREGCPAWGRSHGSRRPSDSVAARHGRRYPRAPGTLPGM